MKTSTPQNLIMIFLKLPDYYFKCWSEGICGISPYYNARQNITFQFRNRMHIMKLNNVSRLKINRKKNLHENLESKNFFVFLFLFFLLSLFRLIILDFLNLLEEVIVLAIIYLDHPIKVILVFDLYEILFVLVPNHQYMMFYQPIIF